MVMPTDLTTSKVLATALNSILTRYNIIMFVYQHNNWRQHNTILSLLSYNEMMFGVGMKPECVQVCSHTKVVEEATHWNQKWEQ